MASGAMKSIVSVSVLLVCLLSIPAASQKHAHPEIGGEPPVAGQLGDVHFPISCAPEVRLQFEQAVAFLHSFQYQQAGTAFRDVAKTDPRCAMAYWGLAMALWHQLWDRPDTSTLKEGWAYIQKAEALGAGTIREREYVAAAAAFYRDPDKEDYLARANLYSAAMGEIYRRNPSDGEAAAFYALSLLASEPPEEESFAKRRRAIAILQKLFAGQPDHPGAAHYLVHACDVPEFAALGLGAAQRYARIAPASPHALHMPSHIFTRLGLWQEAIDSNVASAAAAAKLTSMQLNGALYQIHAMDFLEYAYLQAGRDADARRLIEEVRTVPGATDELLAYPLAYFPARYALETHRWKEAAELAPTTPGVPGITYWARTIGAARSGDPKGARGDLQRLEAFLDSGYGGAAFQVQRDEAAAWVAFAEAKPEEAVKRMSAAADREDSNSTESLSMPAREMLADLWLELRDPAQALMEYERSLKQCPNRFNGLYGAARAAELAGNLEKARTYYAQLAAHRDHTSDRREIEEAGVFLARK
jgi:hypothetical protein